MSNNNSKDLNIARYVIQREVTGKRLESKLPFLNFSSGSYGPWFCQDHKAHFDSVKTLEFSSDGALLASGGCDKRVLIWNVGKMISSLSSRGPVAMSFLHQSIVTCLAFNGDNSILASGGLDGRILLHDIEKQNSVIQEHELEQGAPVYGLNWDPANANVFVAGCEGGLVRLYDTRDPLHTKRFTMTESAIYTLEYHPLKPEYLLTCGIIKGAILWDLRMPEKAPIIRYGNSKASNQMARHAKFNRDGSKVLYLRNKRPPVVYSTFDNQSDNCIFNHPTYANECSIKSGCFGGCMDNFLITGSDNYEILMWKIPEATTVAVNSANIVLKGHLSIPNHVRFNPSQNVLASCGVEKTIKLWSLSPLPNQGELGHQEEDQETLNNYATRVRLGVPGLLSQRVRPLYRLISSSTSSEERDDDDEDELVMREIIT